ncbi:MAG: non-homologous end-joining DNA ligase [Actinomycetota bacterium]
MSTRSRVSVEIEGRELSLSNLDKVLYPAAAFRKADVIDYYRRIGPHMLPHLAGRPPTLVRAPDGPAGQRFFEKRCPPHHPDWVPTIVNVAAAGAQACVVEELPALVWLANLAALEIHTHQWKVDDPEHPTAMVLDLDPGEPATIVDCCRVALELRELLDQLGLRAVVKTSGGKGLHISVPLNSGIATDDDTKNFALALGQMLESRDPKRVTVDMAKEKRRRRVFIDWSQNDNHKTTVCAYSLRIRDQPTASTPIAWDEVEATAGHGAPEDLTFVAPAALERVNALGDLYADVLTVRQELPAI